MRRRLARTAPSRHRDLQPERHLVQGQVGGPGRQRPHLPRTWQRISQPVRTVLRARRKDGLGLNASAGHGHNNVKYYGEYYVKTYINLAANAVVILNRLCYASGNNEWGAGNPTKAVAIKRVDNFAAGFLRANARAVFAEGIDSASYMLRGIFKTDRTIGEIFQSAPSWTGDPRLQVQVGADARVHGLDGPVCTEPLLPLGGRQAVLDRGGRPRRLTGDRAADSGSAGARARVRRRPLGPWRVRAASPASSRTNRFGQICAAGPLGKELAC